MTDTLENIEHLDNGEKDIEGVASDLAEVDESFAEEIFWPMLDQEVIQVLSTRKGEESLKRYKKMFENYPILERYIQIYNHNGKEYFVLPHIHEDDDWSWIQRIDIQTIPLIQTASGEYKRDDGWMTAGQTKHYITNYHAYPVWFWGNDNKFCLDKTTGKIQTWSAEEYTANPQDIMNAIWAEDLSDAGNTLISGILGNENKMKEQQSSFETERKAFVQCIKKRDIWWAIEKWWGMIQSMLNFDWELERTLWFTEFEHMFWNMDAYTEDDVSFLEESIQYVTDPEDKSELTFALSQFKDKKMKEEMWDLSQFDLFLQNCKEGQILLTNWLDIGDGVFANGFNQATQITSWSRWCHSAVVSEVITNSSWKVIDIKVVHATSIWTQEESFRSFLGSERGYSASDFLLMETPEKIPPSTMVTEMRSFIWNSYDYISVWSDVLTGKSDETFLTKNSQFCSEWIFEICKKHGVQFSDPHVSPAQLLTSSALEPQYACTCDSF